MESLKRKASDEAEPQEPSPKRAHHDEDSKHDDDEQHHVLKLIAEGKNVFVTGCGGVGKSYVLKTAIEERRASTGGRILVTATTGIAAVNIGGTTTHKALGIPIEIPNKIDKKPIFAKVDTIFIDEISMMTPECFEFIDKTARESLGKPNVPFGGAQFVAFGDFLQLPPIADSVRFAFESAAWEDAFVRHGEEIELVQVRRQNNPEFVERLNRLRQGELTFQDETFWNSLARPLPPGSNPSEINQHNVNVQKANKVHLDRLLQDADAYEYQVAFLAPDPNEPTKGRVSATGWDLDFLKRTVSVVEHKQTFCVGARVLLVKNISVEHGLANGLLGEIVDFDHSHPTCPVVRFDNQPDHVVVIRHEEWKIDVSPTKSLYVRAIPLILGWALTVHRAMGSTLDKVKFSAARGRSQHGPAYGLHYVAASRVRTPEDLQWQNFDRSQIAAHPKAKQFYKELRDGSRRRRILSINVCA